MTVRYMKRPGALRGAGRAEIVEHPEHIAPAERRYAWQERARRFHIHAVVHRLDELRALAEGLGVGLHALLLLGVGFDERGHSTWPMRGPDGLVCGIRTRASDGNKRAIQGSRSGYFSAAAPMQGGWLLAVEGASDAAAVLTLGPDVVGRASANPGAYADAGALALCRGRDVIVVPDRDPAGVSGAREFTLRALCVARSVRWMFAPRRGKDLRAALVAGLTHDELRDAIAATPPLRARVEVSP